MPDDIGSMFDTLAKQRSKAKKPDPKGEPTPAPTPERSPRQSRKRGKRSDPNYIQVGAYIPKDLDKQVKRKLIDEPGDFSDLVTRLLDDWVNQ